MVQDGPGREAGHSEASSLWSAISPAACVCVCVRALWYCEHNILSLVIFYLGFKAIPKQSEKVLT